MRDEDSAQIRYLNYCWNDSWWVSKLSMFGQAGSSILSLEFIAYRARSCKCVVCEIDGIVREEAGAGAESGQFERRRRSCENEQVSSLCCPPAPHVPLNMFVCSSEGGKFPSRRSNSTTQPAALRSPGSRWDAHSWEGRVLRERG